MVVFTIAARNYLSQASVLFRSIRDNCSNVSFFCFVPEGYDSNSEIPAVLRGNVIDCRLLGIDNYEEMAFKYSVTEFATALKPHIFNHVFEDTGYQYATYLDPDTRLYDGLDWLKEYFVDRSILVTPHVLKGDAFRSTYSGRRPGDDLGIFLRVGAYNAGFLAIQNDAVGRDFSMFLAEILRRRCLKKLCYDQSWVNLIASFYSERVGIVNDAGANVAYWNLHERRLSRDADAKYRVNGSKLKFMHFSKVYKFIDIDASSAMRKIPTILADNPEYIEIYDGYANELIQAEFSKRNKAPYRYDFFDNGIEITPFHRAFFAQMSEKQTVSEPFSATGLVYSTLSSKGLLNNNGVIMGWVARVILGVIKSRLMSQWLLKILRDKEYLGLQQ